jgi:hypothetical protein
MPATVTKSIQKPRSVPPTNRRLFSYRVNSPVSAQAAGEATKYRAKEANAQNPDEVQCRRPARLSMKAKKANVNPTDPAVERSKNTIFMVFPKKDRHENYAFAA